MFRTNSMATKVFKTYSKMSGLEYVHKTVGPAKIRSNLPLTDRPSVQLGAMINKFIAEGEAFNVRQRVVSGFWVLTDTLLLTHSQAKEDVADPLKRFQLLARAQKLFSTIKNSLNHVPGYVSA